MQLTKVFGSGDTRVVALDAVDVVFGRGRFTAIMGDTEITSLDDKRLTVLRRDKVGFVFQAFNLLPTLTAIENITLPMDIAGRKPDP